MKHQKMKQLSKLVNNLSHICILISSCILLLICASLNSCRTFDKQQFVKKDKTYYVVKSIKKKKNGVYVIYAHRNDSVFKIVSLFDGKKKGEKRLKRGMSFNVSLQSVFVEWEREHNMIPMLNVYRFFRGVAIGKEPENDIDDVWFCDELNGPYIIPESQK